MSGPPKSPASRSTFTGSFRRITVIVLGTFTVLYTVAVFAGWVKIVRIPTSSMSPVFEPGDLVISLKFKPDPDELPRGGIAMFNVDDIRLPGDGMKLHGLYFKRIAALPGDTVDAKDGALLVNGNRIERHGSFAVPPGPAGKISPPKLPLIVPEDHVFLLGDNFSNSLDCRYFGPIAVDRIAYRPVFRIYPPSRFGKIE